jgi:hypothetical protein
VEGKEWLRPDTILYLLKGRRLGIVAPVMYVPDGGHLSMPSRQGSEPNPSVVDSRT